MPRPPLKPEFFDKVNYVIEAWSRPCEAPWYIYVETLKPAALAAFITLISFGWDDVARGFLRPRGLGGRRTGKRKGKLLRGVPRFPEIGELIGSQLPGAEEVKGAKWGLLGNALWRIDTLLQQGLFWWLVADVIEDFAFDWTSVLYETRWCQASAFGRFSYRMDEFFTRPGGGWWNARFLIEDYEFDPPSWLVISGRTGSLPCTVAAGLEFKEFPPEGPPTGIEVRIVEDFTLQVFAQSQPGLPGDPSKMTVAVSGTVPPNTFFRVQARHSTTFASFGAGVVTASENPP